MSIAATIERARELARMLEQRERSRVGGIDAARASLARQAGITPTTWRNLTLGRLKRLDAWLRDRLQAMLIAELEAEIGRLTDELEISRARGDHLAANEVREVEAHIAKARAILTGARNAG